MPWKEKTKMDEKSNFIQEVLKKEKPFKHICQDFGISEKTGYKWKNRFFLQGNSGLFEESRASLNHPNQIDADAAAELIRLKIHHETWGPKKIRELYARAYPNKVVPSLSTVKRILDKAGLVKRTRVKPMAASECPRLQQQIKANAPNDVWCIDFKGWWKSSGEVCEPFTVRDQFSRKILCAKLMTSKTSEAVRAVMTDLFKTYGLPKVIHSDNGTPFAAPNGTLNLTKLSIWWITLGILPDRSKKGCPGQNGSLERMHADMAREIQGKISGGISANQAALDVWVETYNQNRPNEAIGMKMPDEVYTKSPRKYEGDFDDIEYPLLYQKRKVTGSGEILIKGLRIMIGYALRGEYVGLKPNEDGITYDVYISNFLLGTVDITSTCFMPLDTLK